MLRHCSLALLLLVVAARPATAFDFRPVTWKSIDKTNTKLHGSLVDLTHNHSCDNRIYSEALCAKRDLYVYLPPCYDPAKQYPVMIYMHAVAQDEVGFLRLVPLIDKAMNCGQLPPMIIAAPDGTIRGGPVPWNGGSFYANSRAGRFEDYIIQDVWRFVKENFPVRPEREYHVLGGASMGGFGAYHLGIKHRDEFGIVAGIFPPLHTRYVDCHGHQLANYNPNCLGLRDRMTPLAPVARYYGGLVTIRQGALTFPIYGVFNKDAIHEIAAGNPYEMIDAYDVKPGQLQLFVAYGKKDEFNLDAQIEAFVNKARCKGLEITSICDPNGRHDTETGERLLPAFCNWIAPRLAGAVADVPSPHR